MRQTTPAPTRVLLVNVTPGAVTNDWPPIVTKPGVRVVAGRYDVTTPQRLTAFVKVVLKVPPMICPNPLTVADRQTVVPSNPDGSPERVAPGAIEYAVLPMTIWPAAKGVAAT